MQLIFIFASIAAGATLLLAGRRLFWLFVAITGFFVGAEVAGDLFASRPQWIVWVLAAGAGIIGAVLAMLLQRVAFAVAGFYAGGYVAIALVQSFGWGMPDVAVSLVGGIIGAVLAALVMDGAIIVLSSLVGSGLIVAALSLQSLQGALLGAAFAAVGIFVQVTFASKKRDAQQQNRSE
jgi:hypothetical protein